MREGRPRVLEEDAHLPEAAVAQGDDQQRLPPRARRAVHPLQPDSARARAPTTAPSASATQRDASGVRIERQQEDDRGEAPRGRGSDTTTPDPRAIAAGEVHAVAASRSRTAAGSAIPSMVRSADSAAGTGRPSSYGGAEAVEHRDVARRAPRATPRPSRRGAGGSRPPAASPATGGGQHPGRPRVEVDLVAVSAGDRRGCARSRPGSRSPRRRSPR